MIRRQPRSKRTDTRLPYTTRVRSGQATSAALPRRRPRSTLRSKTRETARESIRKVGRTAGQVRAAHRRRRSEEHTSELQSLLRISYAVFCLQKKPPTHTTTMLTPQHTSTPQALQQLSYTYNH